MDMKKGILIVLCLLVFGGGVFAQNMAFGGGVMFNLAWTNWSWEDYYYDPYYMGGVWVTDSWTDSLSRQGFGGFVFLGLGKYAELNFGFLYKNPSKLKYTLKDDYGFEDSDTIDVNFIDGCLGLQFGIYFKYPFVVSDKLVVFPTAGADFELALDESWWNDLWIRGGIGLDIFVTQNAFVRVHALYGYGIVIDSDFHSYTDTLYSHGLLIKAGVGFMF